MKALTFKGLFDDGKVGGGDGGDDNDDGGGGCGGSVFEGEGFIRGCGVVDVGELAWYAGR
jgi:hypothetical protein